MLELRTMLEKLTLIERKKGVCRGIKWVVLTVTLHALNLISSIDVLLSKHVFLAY
jgi:hypothetical protein